MADHSCVLAHPIRLLGNTMLSKGNSGQVEAVPRWLVRKDSVPWEKSLISVPVICLLS